MDYAFPEKYYRVVTFCEHEFGDIEATTMLSDQQKLVLYALRQQADHGSCAGEAPSLFRTHARAKHDAWKQLDGMSKYEAMVQFVRYVEECLGGRVNWAERLNAVREKKLGDVAGPLSSAPNDIIAPDDVDESVSVSDSHSWDDDLRAHLTPTVENVHYLASQVMELRRQLDVLRKTAGGGKEIEQRKDIAGDVTTEEKQTQVVLENTCLASPPQDQSAVGWAEWLGLTW